MYNDHMNTATTATRKVELWVHTNCGLEFELIDAETKKSLTGRMFWCDDEELEEDEEIESDGWAHFRAFAMKKKLEIVEEVWS